MTTNHRPTLESKRGKNQGITDSIAHARSLPQQTRLKFRNDVQGAKISKQQGRKAYDALKADTARDASKADTPLRDVSADGSALTKVIPSGEKRDEMKSEKDGIADSISTREESLNSGNSDSEKESEDKDSEESQSEDEDSEDETAALMEELAKIKQERREAKENKESEKQLQKALTSNPLVQVGSSAESSQKDGKKSWRKSTPFSNTTKTAKKDDEFTNDTLNSDFHQKFLSKYIR